MRAYVMHAMRRSDAPAAFHLGTGLAVLAAAAPPSLGLPWPPSTMRGNFWALLAGPSGDRKSAAISIGADMLREADPRVCSGETPGSPEGLASMLRDSPRRIITYSEFGTFLAQTEKGQAAPLRETFTHLYDSPAETTMTYRAKQVTISEPRLSILAGSSPAYLARYTQPADWEGGFLSRFLCLAAKQERSIAIPPMDWQPEFARCVEMLRVRSSTGAEQMGTCGGFAPTAAVKWADWYADQLRQRVPDRIHGALKRTQNVALKVALLYSFDLGLSRCGKGSIWLIDETVLEPAFKVADLHLKSIRYLCDHIAEDDEMRRRQAVLRAIASGAGTLGDIMLQSRLLKRRATEIIETLEIERTVRKVKGEDGTETYELRDPDAY